MFERVRQGNPLSPMLVVLVVEALAQLLLRAQNTDCISGFKVSIVRQGLPIIQFADDTLLFIDRSANEATCLRDLLVWFKVFFRLRVNPEKSIIFKVNKVDDWESIVECWGCKVGTFLVLHLGLPLGVKTNILMIWETVLERVRKN